MLAHAGSVAGAFLSGRGFFAGARPSFPDKLGGPNV
jgi:hypothetical protein